MKKVIVVALFGIVTMSQAFAGDCELVTDRTACPGKEDEAYKPYLDKGKNPTKDTKQAADIAACKKLGKDGAGIVRTDILAKKKVTAKFNGADAGTYEEKSNCK